MFYRKELILAILLSTKIDDFTNFLIQYRFSIQTFRVWRIPTEGNVLFLLISQYVSHFFT